VAVNREAGAPRRRMARRVNREADSDEEDDVANEERQNLEDAGVALPDGKIGKKKMAKLQEKADKKLQREAEQKEREEDKKRKLKQDEEDKVMKEKEQDAEQLIELEQKKIREEREREEYEEYLKMKEAFTIEEVGCDAGEEGDEENMLAKFINYIKAEKIVMLEDLAAHFKMKTQDTIDRVAQLQEDGMLTGVTDDRGKFIYISQEELESVAKFIRQQGRVSIADLASSSNKLITLAKA